MLFKILVIRYGSHSNRLDGCCANRPDASWEIEPYGEAKQGWLQQFYMYGMKVEADHWERETIDNVVIDVVKRYDVSVNGLVFEKQATY